MHKLKTYLPEHAKLVFVGQTYEVRQREQEMYDGTKKIFEKLKRRYYDVAIIAVVADKIIVQAQQQPHRDLFISLPGGMDEEGEDPQQTAYRELLEETGYTPEEMILWKALPSPYSSILRESYYFIAKNCKKVSDMSLDNGEKIRNEMISFEDFLLLSDNNNFRHIELLPILLSMRVHPEELTVFKESLFTNSQKK